MNDYQSEDAYVKFADRANLFDIGMKFRAISVSDAFDETFDVYDYNSDTDLGLTEQLYTARGSQGLATSQKFAEKFISNLD